MSQIIETVSSDGQDLAVRRRLDGGISDGVEVVTLSLGDVSLDVCPTRGMGILDIQFGETRVGWDSPVAGPVHPAFVDLNGRNKLGWLDGFSELVARCGLVSVGPPGVDDEAGPIAGDLTLHGRVANIPAGEIEIGYDDDGVFVRGTLHESVLFGPQLKMTSETRLTNEGVVFVRDEIQNLGASETEYQLLYHINIGPPVLSGGSKVSVDRAESVCPRDPRAAEGIDTWDNCLPPTSGYAEQAYFFEPSAGERELSVASLVTPRGQAFQVCFDPNELPCFTLWKCTQSLEAGYVVGLEPGTNFPNHKSFERRHGRVPVLAPGEKAVKSLELRLTETESGRSVAEIPVIHRVPTEPIAPAVS